MSPGIELATSRTEGRALTNCAILGLNYLQSLSVFSNAKFSCPDDHSFARKENQREGVGRLMITSKHGTKIFFPITSLF